MEILIKNPSNDLKFIEKDFLELSDEIVYDVLSNYYSEAERQDDFINSINSDFGEIVDSKKVLEEVNFLMQHKLSELNFKNEDDLESENLQINFDPKSKEHLDKCQKIANLLVKEN